MLFSCTCFRKHFCDCDEAKYRTVEFFAVEVIYFMNLLKQVYQSINQSLFKTGNMAHKTYTGNRHIYEYIKHLKTQYDKEKEKKKER